MKIDSGRERKREMIACIGKIVLNHDGELYFKLKEPFNYASEIARSYNQYFISSEPKLYRLGTTKTALSEPLVAVWRDGRDSNPRPPQ